MNCTYLQSRHQLFTLLNHNSQSNQIIEYYPLPARWCVAPLLALVLHRDHDHVGLVYQVRRAREHDGRLTLLEILLQRVGKLLTILHKLPLSLLQGMFTLK